MEKQKKKTIILTIALAVIAIALIGAFAFIELRENGIIGSSESGKIIADFNKNYNSKEKKVILYASSECPYCDLLKPILDTVVEDYDIEYYGIDSTLLSGSQKNQIIEKLNIDGRTPTLVIVENGKVLATQIGFVDGGALVDFFKENKIVPEDAVYSLEKYITFVDYDEYKNLIRDDDTNIIVIGQTTCSHCINYKPALNSVAEDYDITINYLNLTELEQEESQNFYESLEKIGYDDPDFVENGSFGTPTTLVVKDGKVISYISGERTYSQLVREFTEIGIIEE